MGNSSDATERERYERALAALFGLAQALLTLQGLATLHESDMRGLVVENIGALLDDMQLANDTSQWLGIHGDFAARRLQLEVAELDSQAAIQYGKFDAAIRRAEGAFRTLTEVRIDTLADEVRSQLASAIGSAKEAFRLLATVEGTPNPALLTAITEKVQAVDDFARAFESLGYEATFGVRDSASVVTPLDSRPYERLRSALAETREALRRPYRDNNPGGGMSPFGR